jgi:hypothetical protein
MLTFMYIWDSICLTRDIFISGCVHMSSETVIEKDQISHKDEGMQP